ncbi:hypothetical protein [Bradyrhizobium sp. HKCCYLS20291]|uniref:hypothetical protein n=1 Tax=Bradyrhizobium sp. HKCCYLS20291 TaxID=3420766 RepID=UPI003EC13016
MPQLKLISLCDYLTDTDVRWRKEDFRAHKMVKALKGDPINGYFSSRVGGKWREYDKTNVQQFVDRLPRALFANIRRFFADDATIVPIPNSHVVSVDTPEFKTLEIAEKIAHNSKGLFAAVPALVFKKAQQKSRLGGPRDAAHFEEAYKITASLEGPIILYDDVCTTGGHLIAAYHRLNSKKSPVVLACTFGRSTKQQAENPVGLREGCLEV